LELLQPNLLQPFQGWLLGLHPQPGATQERCALLISNLVANRRRSRIYGCRSKFHKNGLHSSPRIGQRPHLTLQGPTGSSAWLLMRTKCYSGKVSARKYRMQDGPQKGKTKEEQLQIARTATIWGLALFLPGFLLSAALPFGDQYQTLRTALLAITRLGGWALCVYACMVLCAVKNQSGCGYVYLSLFFPPIGLIVCWRLRDRSGKWEHEVQQ